MTIDEAHTLQDVLARIEGSITTSRRFHAEAISNALADIDVHFSDARRDVSGSIEFKRKKDLF